MKALTVAEYKRAWFTARRAELHGRGLKDAEIAGQMGYKPPYFSQIVAGANVGDKFIDKMCASFGFRFIPSEELRKPETDDGAMREEMKLLRESVQSLMSLATTLMEERVKRSQQKASQS